MSLLQQNHVKYGLVMSGLMALCMLWKYLTQDYSVMQNPSIQDFLLAFAIPLTSYFLGLRAFRKQLKGKLSFKQGLNQSFKISLVVGVTSPFVFLFFYILDPNLIEFARQAYGMVGSSNNTVVTVDLIVQLVASIIMGTIIGAAFTFFLKSK